MIRARTRAVAETQALAGRLADLAVAGDVILLAGELGAGKTAFAQGFGAALGVTDQITSPTFTLARQYRGRLVMHHLDVYRLERFSEMQDVGIAELLDDGGVVLIEWGDAIAPALPSDYLEIRLTYPTDAALGDDSRTIELRGVGPRWSARERSMTEALAEWAL